MEILSAFGGTLMAITQTHSLDVTCDKVGIKMQDKPFQPLWGTNIPGQIKTDGVETDITKPGEGLVMGKRVARIANVSVPGIAVYAPPKSKQNGAAVVVCPGGGFSILAMDLEGTEVATWLNSIGVTAIVLKYRVPTGSFDPNWLGPTMDAQRAISVTRQNAKEWGIDPTRIGVLGFSAGGKTAAMAAISSGKRVYFPTDNTDTVPCNADFGVLVYPAYIVDKDNQLNQEVKLRVGRECPPMFFAHTADDPVTPQSTLVLAGALQAAKVPVEVHLYPNGGHGYGLRPDKTKQVTSWPERCADWMRNRGIIR